MAETTTETPKKVLLRSSDKEEFEVDETVALESQTIKHMIEDGCANAVIPLPNVLGKTLSIVLEYCKKHVELTAEFGAKAAAESTNELPYDETLPITVYNRPVLIPELEAWKAEFIKVDLDTLYDLLLASNYLNVKSLMDLATQTVADMCKGKSPEEIREIFNIKNDFTPEEEAKIRSENQWCFE